MMRLFRFAAVAVATLPFSALAESADTEAILNALAKIESRLDGLQKQIDELKAKPSELSAAPLVGGEKLETVVKPATPQLQGVPLSIRPAVAEDPAPASAARLRSSEAIETGSTEPLPPLFPTSGIRVILEELNVRSRQSTSASLATRLEPGMQVRLIAKTSDEEWHQVAVGDRVIGFVKTTALAANS
jgi:hypothetical protein